MTTNAMNCELFSDQLMAYLENEVDDATRSAVERHSVTCAECGPLLADLRKLRVDAANLPALKPSRDLWSGIAERIETPVLDIGTAREVVVAPSRVAARRWWRGALIAASLVGAAGLGYLVPRTNTTETSQPQVADAPAASVASFSSCSRLGPGSVPEFICRAATRIDQSASSGSSWPRRSSAAMSS